MKAEYSDALDSKNSSCDCCIPVDVQKEVNESFIVDVCV
jgi:hypothetical protein